MEGNMEKVILPRVKIQFCTQCRWMLRAAYFAQELLSTFGNALGEVALQPSTGGTFVVKLYYRGAQEEGSTEGVRVREHLLWDRKVEGGFPETKELKRRVRDVIDPKRDLGHIDGKKNATKPAEPQTQDNETPSAPAPIPKAVNILRESGGGEGGGERKFTPMDIDPDSRRGSDVGGEKEKDGGVCKTGAECEDCG